MTTLTRAMKSLHARRLSILLSVFALPPLATASQSVPTVGGRLAFVPNQGQWPGQVLFAADAPSLRVRAERDAIGVDLLAADTDRVLGAYVRLRFVDCSDTVAPFPGEPEPGVRHYFLGSDPDRWRTRIPTYDSVVWASVWPGVDVVLEERDGVASYTIRAEAGVDPGLVQIELEGADRVQVDAEGNLYAPFEFGTLRHSAPRAWLERADGARVPTSASVVDRGERRIGFALGQVEESSAWVIDPGLTFSSYLGGSFLDEPTRTLAIDQHRILVAGYTQSADFPSTPGPFQWVGLGDAFVGQLDLSREPTLEFMAFVGGNGTDRTDGLALDPAGRIYLAGLTDSANLPTTPGAFDTSYGGDSTDGFVACIGEAGTELVYCTYVGGSQGTDELIGIAVDAQGRATAVGRTTADDFPTTEGAFQHPPVKVAPQGTVTRLNPDGTALEFSTLIGGLTDIEKYYDVAVDNEGNTYIVGGFVGFDYPKTPNAVDVGPLGGALTKLDPTGGTLLASTVVGGSHVSDLHAIALGPGGRVYVAGKSSSSDYPISPGAYDSQQAGWPDEDVVVTVLDGDLTQVLYSTFLGQDTGEAIQVALDLAVDASGVVTIAGETTAGNLPTTAGSAQPEIVFGSKFAFLSRFDPKLEKLLYWTFLHGTQSGPEGGALSEARGVAILPDGSAVVVGNTTTPDFPLTPDAPQSSYLGNSDGYVNVLDMLPLGVERFGPSTPACQGPIWIGVTEQPTAGSGTFGITSSGSPPDAVGVLALATLSSPVGIPILGIVALVDLASVTALLPASTDGTGWCERPLPLPATSQGKSASCQFLWLNTATCGGQGSFSSSSALELTVQ